jgi:hypothetical protein
MTNVRPEMRNSWHAITQPFNQSIKGSAQDGEIEPLTNPYTLPTMVPSALVSTRDQGYFFDRRWRLGRRRPCCDLQIWEPLLPLRRRE